MYIVKKILWGWGSKNLNMVKKTIQIKKKIGHSILINNIKNVWKKQRPLR